MSAPLRVGIVGAGAFVEAAHLPGLQSHPDAHVVAICGRRPERARELARRFDVPSVAADYRELCARDDIDAVTIVTPNALHREVALAALAHGKHVLCEKPLDVAPGGAEAMLGAARESGRVHQVAFTFRYLYGVEELRRRVRRGDVGEPLVFRASHERDSTLAPGFAFGWQARRAEAGGGVLYDVGSHLFDLARFLLGDLEAVRGSRRAIARSAPAETDDVATAALRLVTGASGSWVASRVNAASFENHVLVAGREGALVALLSRGRVDTLRLARPGVSGWSELPLAAAAADGAPHAARRMMHAFVDACRRGAIDSELDADFADGVAVQRAIDAVERSCDSGWIRLDR